jgi:UDP-2,3-diacylglucosamine hydrolase
LLQLFLRFLREPAARAEALYILGDLFDAWLGDDDDDPAYARVKTALAEFSASGVPVYFMRGNRDFLIGENFSRETGCRLLPDPSVITLYGEPVLLMHGDTLCTRDLAYQQFRMHIRQPAWRQQFLAKRLSERRAIAASLRAQSQAYTQHQEESLMDVTPEAVNEAMRGHQARRLIHGHTHRPGSHHFDLDGQPASRVVLGDWHRQGSVLACTPAGCALREYPAPG